MLTAFTALVIWSFIPSLHLGLHTYTILGILFIVFALLWFFSSLKAVTLWFKKRSGQFVVSLMMTVTALILVLGSLNYFSSLDYFNKSFDLTKNKLYSLGGQSQKLLKKIKQPVQITVWTSHIAGMSQNFKLKNYLENYVNYSNGKVSLLIKNPSANPISAEKNNVRMNNIIVVKNLETGRESRIDSFNDKKVEEQVTNALAIVTSMSHKKTICFLAGHGELVLDDDSPHGMSILKKKLEGINYATKEIELFGKKELPSECELLVVVGPSKVAFEAEFDVIKKYMAQGKPTMFFMGLGTPLAWREVAKGFGVVVEENLVIDQRVSLPGTILSKNYSPAVEIVEGFDSPVVFPQVSTISVKKMGKLKARTFISTEKQYSYAKVGDLKSLKTTKREASDRLEALPIGVIIEKNIETSTKDLNPKKDKNHDHNHGHDHDHGFLNSIFPVAFAQDLKGNVLDDLKGLKKLSVVLYSSHYLASNQMLQQYGNLDLIMNSVSYLLKDKSLIGIRPKEIKSTTLVITWQRLRSLIGTILMIGISFLVTGFYVKRRRSF